MSRRLRHTFLIAAVALVGVGAAGPALAEPVAPRPKAIVLTATPATIGYGQATTLALALTPKGGGTPKGGTVTFSSGDQVLGTAVATRRITVVSTRALPIGEHTVVASYSGDTVIGEATSNPVTVTVTPGRTTTTVRSTGTAAVGDPSEIKAVVRTPGSSTRPTGTVAFTSGSRTATVRINALGVATWRPILAEGEHEVTATYAGTGSYGPSTGSTSLRVGTSVDQSNLGPATGTVSGRRAQVFTAGRSGLLEVVTVSSPSTGETLTLEIWAVVGSSPEQVVLGTGSATTTGGLVDVTLDVPVPVTAGTRYGIVSPPFSGGPELDVTDGTAYAGGDGQQWIRGSFYVDGNLEHDLIFATWVR
jgi:large repetitive protein